MLSDNQTSWCSAFPTTPSCYSDYQEYSSNLRLELFWEGLKLIVHPVGDYRRPGTKDFPKSILDLGNRALSFVKGYAEMCCNVERGFVWLSPPKRCARSSELLSLS